MRFAGHIADRCLEGAGYYENHSGEAAGWQDSFALLSDVQSAGLTAMQFASNIRKDLTKYLNNPQPAITVTQIKSRRVFVIGDVARSGVMLLLPSTTVLQALSASGGFTQFAKEKAIYLLRNDSGKQVKLPYNCKDF